MKLEKARAKHHGMTVEELRAYQARLRSKKREEQLKYEEWKIEQKYKRKRKQAKKGKSGGIAGFIEFLGGSPQKTSSSDPLGLFGTPKKKRKKRRKK